MNSLAVFFFALVAYVNAAPLEAERYPANLDASLCPNYPICDNLILFGTQPAAPLPEVPAPVALRETPGLMSLPEVPLEAERYPANFDASLCPNYPICDNLILFGTQPAVPLPEVPAPVALRETPGLMSLPEVPSLTSLPKAPAVMSLPEAPATMSLPTTILVPGADFLTSFRPHEYPPGVHPSACPNFPFCNVSEIVLPLPGFSTRLYPPGVHPSACPNYPLC